MSSTLRTGLPAAPAARSLDSAAGVSWSVGPASEVPADWAALAARPCAATVPGEVHVDLLAAGLIPDPFDGDNESTLSWIGRTNWIYRAGFEWDGSDSRPYRSGGRRAGYRRHDQAEWPGGGVDGQPAP